MSNFQEWLDKQMQCPEFRDGFDEIGEELELAIQIAKIRNDQSLTQKELADKVGLAQSHISRLENGRYNPSLQFLRKVASGLGKQVYIELR